MIRLRTGNRPRRGPDAEALSRSSTAPARGRASVRVAWRRGYTTSRPVATTPTAEPPASSAPSCAAPSMPIARPLTTVTPASARVAPSSRHRRARAASRRACRRPRPAARAGPRARRPRRAAPRADRGRRRGSGSRERRRPRRASRAAARRRAVERRIGACRPPTHELAPVAALATSQRGRDRALGASVAHAARVPRSGPHSARRARGAAPASCRGGRQASPRRSRSAGTRLRRRTSGLAHGTSSRSSDATATCSGAIAARRRDRRACGATRADPRRTAAGEPTGLALGAPRVVRGRSRGSEAFERAGRDVRVAPPRRAARAARAGARRRRSTRSADVAGRLAALVVGARAAAPRAGGRTGRGAEPTAAGGSARARRSPQRARRRPEPARARVRARDEQEVGGEA